MSRRRKAAVARTVPRPQIAVDYLHARQARRHSDASSSFTVHGASSRWSARVVGVQVQPRQPRLCLSPQDSSRPEPDRTCRIIRILSWFSSVPHSLWFDRRWSSSSFSYVRGSLVSHALCKSITYTDIIPIQSQ